MKFLIVALVAVIVIQNPTTRKGVAGGLQIASDSLEKLSYELKK
jgi:hypothetical protein|tara:strand:- start:247 stop:378 length:132 start_codon:yes stop_codon:yes gene_type:complete